MSEGEKIHITDCVRNKIMRSERKVRPVVLEVKVYKQREKEQLFPYHAIRTTAGLNHRHSHDIQLNSKKSFVSEGSCTYILHTRIFIEYKRVYSMAQQPL